MIKDKIKIGLFIVMLAIFGLVGFAYAADLTWTADSIVALSSPAINLTISSGSTATSLVVNTGTVVVTVPASGTFTISSADRMLLSTGEDQFGVINTTCSSGLVSTMAITAPSTGSESITITPATNQCTTGSGGGGSGSGGGGTYTPPPVTTPPTVTPPTVPTPTNITFPTDITFTKAVNVGSSKVQIKNLQKVLNVALGDALKIKLKEDGKWGAKTSAAIRQFQKASKITPVNGVVGAKTRAALNALNVAQ